MFDASDLLLDFEMKCGVCDSPLLQEAMEPGDLGDIFTLLPLGNLKAWLARCPRCHHLMLFDEESPLRRQMRGSVFGQ